nr:uncharacterized protein LOC124214434 [Neodiprion pinetum]
MHRICPPLCKRDRACLSLSLYKTALTEYLIDIAQTRHVHVSISMYPKEGSQNILLPGVNPIKIGAKWYSNVVPKTLWGRLISIIYALTGIPLLLVYLSTVGDVLARSFGRLYGRLCRPRSCTRKPSKAYHNHVDSKSGGNYYPSKDSSCDDLGRAGSVVLLDCGSEGLQAASSSTALDPGSKGHLHHGFHHRLPCPKAVRIPITLCLLIIIAYICGGAVLFNRLEGWSLLESSYFCFTSLGTIGFGDLVPGGAAAPSAILEELSLCATSLYILLGMGLIAMCFNLVQEQVLHVVRAVGRFCGMGGAGPAEGAPDCRGPGAPDDEGIPMSVSKRPAPSPGHHSLPRKKIGVPDCRANSHFQRGQPTRRSGGPGISPDDGPTHFEYFVPRSVSEFNLAAAVSDIAVPPPPASVLRPASATSALRAPGGGPQGGGRIADAINAAKSREKMVTFEDEGTSAVGSTPTRKNLTALGDVFM